MRPFALLACLVASVALLWLHHRAPAVGAPVPTATLNGDTDGSGRIDITDAVYLLQWLFQGGPAPAEIECAPSLLPSTGADTCWNSAGEEIACDAFDYPQQDAQFRRGCSPIQDLRYVDHGDGTVTDTCTGLMWRKDTTIDPTATWQEALQFANAAILAMDGTWTFRAAEAAEHGGVRYDDWRLPNVRELASIVDYGRFDPAVHPALSVDPAGYWTSTTFEARPGTAWCVHLFDGQAEGILKTAHLEVMMVRGGERE